MATPEIVQPKPDVELGGSEPKQVPGDENTQSLAAPTKVVGIVSAARSGSTALDIALGNHPDAMSTGELSKLFSHGVFGEIFCSCGVEARRCPFWLQVLDVWRTIEPEASPEGYLGLQKLFERPGRKFGLRTAPQRGAWPYFDRYSRQSSALYRAISTVSGKTTIIDSSKHPGRAVLLARTEGVDLRLLHLVRDVRGFTASMKKIKRRNLRAGVGADWDPEPTWLCAARWSKVNLEAEWAARRLGRYRALRIRYEDIGHDVEGSFRRMGALIGLDLTHLARSIETGALLTSAHTVAGNWVRMSGNLRFALDEQWKDSLPTHDKLLLRLLAGGLMAYYGY